MCCLCFVYWNLEWRLWGLREVKPSENLRCHRRSDEWRLNILLPLSITSKHSQSHTNMHSKRKAASVSDHFPLVNRDGCFSWLPPSLEVPLIWPFTFSVVFSPPEDPASQQVHLTVHINIQTFIDVIYVTPLGLICGVTCDCSRVAQETSDTISVV